MLLVDALSYEGRDQLITVFFQNEAAINTKVYYD